MKNPFAICIRLAAIALTIWGESHPACAAELEKEPADWKACGWGGGGFYYTTVFHPTRSGVLYLGGDVGGVYKSEDFGRNWRMINKGLVNYGVFSLAVDRNNPETVYAATEDGLCKSTDGGENWKVLPQTGRKELRITGEKNKSIRSVAVDPSDGNIVYAASPAGKVYKSTDGGQSWNLSYTKELASSDSSRLRVQYGKVNANFFGGFWLPLKYPEGLLPEDAVGLGINFKGDKSAPQDCYVILRVGDGSIYRSKNLSGLFADDSVREVVLRRGDFALDPEYAKKNPDKVASVPVAPEWSKVVRMDMSCSGPLPDRATVASLGSVSFAVTRTADGKTGTEETPVLVIAHDFASDKKLQSYGNISLGDPVSGSIFTVAVSGKDPNLVVAATNDSGLVMSSDKGATWKELDTPEKAAGACFDPADPNVIYATFFTDGVWKSADRGATWKKITDGMLPDISFREIVVSPANSQDVYALGLKGWGGTLYISNDGGATWKSSNSVISDHAANPTLPGVGEKTPLSVVTNISLDPANPKQLYISANWRSCFSDDGGMTLKERMKGADISCITDIRFSGKSTYVTAMDEGTLVSEDQGRTWKQLWPLKHDWALSGHNWRVAVNQVDGVDRIISTASPWDKYPNRVVISEDAGKTYQVVTEGLPDYIPTANTMWGRGYARAMAVDPSNPKIVYLGLDGDPTPGKSGGGIFKSGDGGRTWIQLPNQPGSRRMYYGLAIDPTDTKRIYWGAFGDKGGVWLSEDSGGSWQHVFTKDQYLFNVVTTEDGTVYASGKELWRSVDKGKTWTQISHLNNKSSITGIAVHPRDSKTIWVSSTVWNGDAIGGIYKTTDGGATWKDITGNIDYIRPQILSFNPDTNELWAGFVGLFKLKQ